MRLISVSQYFKEPKYGNYGITDDIPLVDFFTDDNNQSDIEVEPFLTIDSSADDIKLEEKQSLYYLLGSIIRNMSADFPD